MAAPRTHLIIPDTQAKPGVPTDHLRWIGNYVVERRPEVVVHLGDHADMPSLSSWDAGKRDFEGRRYHLDIEAANDAWRILNAPLVELNAHKRALKERQWWPERHIVLGNHENRIDRAANDDAKLTGLISTEDLDYGRSGWIVHPYLKPIEIDGIWYSHFWANGMGRPLGGAALTRLKSIGHSFVQGHQQTLDFATRFLANGEQQIGIVAGACYLHHEDYLGFQGNAHWRGLIVLHQVENGAADIMVVSLDYLCRRYEGKTLEAFMAKNYPTDA
jgi:hypothetical protein